MFYFTLKMYCTAVWGGYHVRDFRVTPNQEEIAVTQHGRLRNSSILCGEIEHTFANSLQAFTEAGLK